MTVLGPIPERGVGEIGGGEPPEFAGVPDGHLVAASSISPTGQWRIVADTRRPDNIGALTIERIWGAIAGTSSTTGDRDEPPLDLQADISDGTVVGRDSAGQEVARNSTVLSADG